MKKKKTVAKVPFQPHYINKCKREALAKLEEEQGKGDKDPKR